MTTATRAGHARTDRAGRYLKQLCSHFAQKVDADWGDATGHVAFDAGTCRLVAEHDRLLLHVQAPTVDGCARVAGIVDNHLVRFGAREGLAVEWQGDPAVT